MSCSGAVKSFVAQKGFGFIDFQGADVFVHIKDCQGGAPQQGDTVSFDLVDSETKPGSKRASNVTGGTGPMRGVVGSGSCQGSVKSFNPVKGFGFIECQGAEVFVHVKDCLGGCPQQGDMVAFDAEDSPSKPGTKVAKNVTGGSGYLEDAKGFGKGKEKGWGYEPMWGGKGGCGGKGMMSPYGGWGKGWGKGW
mmetsp:Transcript_116056/g.248183  ORF Transcript_116056/g.248183 Transcript_116056/m.248183 type:complete len:193 (-) Transcript_116056:52-630(-)